MFNYSFSYKQLYHVIHSYIFVWIVTELDLGGTCSMDSMCLNTNSLCDIVTQECTCQSDYYDSNNLTNAGGDCRPSKCIVRFNDSLLVISLVYRLLDSLVVECWLRVREVPGSIPNQVPRHTKDVLKMVPVVPLFSTQQHSGCGGDENPE